MKQRLKGSQRTGRYARFTGSVALA